MKRIRLDPSAYQQGHCFSLSIAAAKRASRFTEANTVRLCLGALEETAKRFNASVFAYCFMPDHLHLLIALPSGFSLVQFVRHFKQLSAYRCRREGSQGALWQARFYDHALRREESLPDMARYVWENPVRAGLAENPSDYSYSGSFVWEEARERETVGV
jgi:putative transposase